jgi:hypothetical protein
MVFRMSRGLAGAEVAGILRRLIELKVRVLKFPGTKARLGAGPGYAGTKVPAYL